ncbi:uncharacterized protein LOC125678726 [Ostrea edulis]|uniref:uncharacterized protein LOC125678726 n=1 Tax=Ostrea edulis TaxID=37623 RepID=UPI0024AF2B77|nr:uncharacterized protein LOC125678726 [Ostrea edulis]
MIHLVVLYSCLGVVLIGLVISCFLVLVRVLRVVYPEFGSKVDESNVDENSHSITIEEPNAEQPTDAPQSGSSQAPTHGLPKDPWSDMKGYLSESREPLSYIELSKRRIKK